MPAQLNFTQQTSISSGGTPRDIVQADFNMDGKPDIAVTHDAGYKNVRVFLGNGTGSFVSPSFTYRVGQQAFALITADFNMDGKPDLAAANGDSNTVSIALGDGTGGFLTSYNFVVNGGPSNVISADFNLDGKPDIAAANYGAGTVAVLLGDGAGGLNTAGYYSIGNGTFDIESTDLDNNGSPDLIVTQDGPSQIAVLMGNGAGGFSAPVYFGLGGYLYPLYLLSADFNEDGKKDIATSNIHGDVSILLGKGDGSFAPSLTFNSINDSYEIACADFNGDNHLDLAVCSGSSTPRYAILLGIGNGYFCKSAQFYVGNYVESIVTGDFNLDGKPDLALDPWIYPTLSVQLNHSTIPGPMSIVGDSLICAGQSTTLSTISQGYPVYWTGPEPDTTKISGGLSATVNQQGVYTVHIDKYCLDTASFFLKTDVLTASFVASPTLGIAPANIDITSTSQATYGTITNYTWSLGDGTTVSPGTPNISYEYDQTGSYRILLQVTDNLGCYDSVSLPITIIKVTIPNVFTPNGDHINDEFFIKGDGITNIECNIYDRWGSEVYGWTGNTNGWTGWNKNGNFCDDGTYFYVLKYNDLAHRSYTQNGFIQLER